MSSESSPKDTGETKTDVAVTTNTAQTDTSEVQNNYYPYQEYDPAYYPIMTNYPYFPYYPEGIPPMMYPVPQPMPPPQTDDGYDPGHVESTSTPTLPPESAPVMQQPFISYMLPYDYFEPSYDYDSATNSLNPSPHSRRYSFENNKSTPRLKPSTPSSGSTHPIKKLNLQGINEFNPRDYNQKDIPLNPTVVKGFIIHVPDIATIINSFNNKTWVVNSQSDLHILEDAFKRIGERGPIYLFYHVNGEDCLCGMARMTNRPNNRLEYRNNNKDQTDSTASPLSSTSSPSSSSSSSSSSTAATTTTVINNKVPVEWLFSKNIPIKKIEEIMTSNIYKQFNLISSPSCCEMSFEFVKQLLSIFSTYEHETSFLDI